MCISEADLNSCKHVCLNIFIIVVRIVVMVMLIILLLLSVVEVENKSTEKDSIQDTDHDGRCNTGKALPLQMTPELLWVSFFTITPVILFGKFPEPCGARAREEGGGVLFGVGS